MIDPTRYAEFFRQLQLIQCDCADDSSALELVKYLMDLDYGYLYTDTTTEETTFEVESATDYFITR